MLLLILDIILLLAWLFSAIMLGDLMLRPVRLTFVSPLERFLFAAGLGWAVFVYTLVGLATVGGLYSTSGRILSGVSLVIALIYSRRWLPFRCPVWPRLTRLEKGWLTLLALFGGLGLVAVLSPPSDWDSLMYHLEAPKRYIQAHGYIYLTNGLTNLPQFVESLYAWAMLLNDDILARLVNLTLGGLSVLAVYTLARRQATRKLALLAALIFVGNPLTMFVFVEVFIEAGLTFYSLLAILALLTWRDQGDRRWLWLGAVFVGMALGMKYYAIILVPILAWALLDRAVRVERLPASAIARLAAVTALIILPFPLPWLIKNVIFTGDPVFPVISGWLGGWGHGLTQASAAWNGRGYALLDYLLLPWRMTFDDRFGMPRPGLLFLLLLPLWLGLPRASGATRWLAGVIALWFIFWTNSAGQSVRFFLPGFALLSVVSAALLNKLPGWARPGRPLLLALITAITGYYLIWPTWFASWALPFVAGQESRAEYLHHRLDIYPVAAYANQHLPPTARIATVWEERGYYFDQFLVIGMSPDGAFLHHFGQGDDPARLAHALLSRGLTYLIINNNLQREQQFNLSDRYMYGVETTALLAYTPVFQNCFLRPLFNYQQITLYEVRPESICWP